MSYDLEWLTNKFDQGETIKYIFFWGHSNKNNESIGKFVFSQWYPASFTVDGVEYKTAEHWMMAQKADMFEDTASFQKIINADKPAEVKELGRRIQPFNEIQWNKHKLDIVKTGNIHKFNQNRELLDFLISTGDRVLVEASPADVVWGIGLDQNENMVDNPYTWRGTNLLGFALMETRDFLRDFGTFEHRDFDFPPPWKKYPGVDPLEMFWRMGYGEQYITDYAAYFNKLSDREKKIYELSYPQYGQHWNP